MNTLAWDEMSYPLRMTRTLLQRSFERCRDHGGRFTLKVFEAMLNDEYPGSLRLLHALWEPLSAGLERECGAALHALLMARLLRAECALLARFPEAAVDLPVGVGELVREDALADVVWNGRVPRHVLPDVTPTRRLLPIHVAARG